MRRITWRRVVDMNDRALRDIVVGLGGPANGFPRQDGFDIVVASEVMAIFCLATSLADLKERLGNIVVGYTREQKPILRARPEGARRDDGAAARRAGAQPGADAREQPGVHPRRPVRQHRARLQLGDRHPDRAQARRLRRDRGRLRRRPGRREVRRHQVPQGGAAARAPWCIVATMRALKYHGGVELEGPQARRTSRRSRRASPTSSGTSTTSATTTACRASWRSTTVTEDTEAEIELLQPSVAPPRRARSSARPTGPRAARAPTEVAREVVRLCEQPNNFHFVYEDSAPLWDKMKAIATKIYGASRHHRRQQGARADQAAAGGRLRALPGVRRQDAVLVLDRSEAARRAQPATWSTSARCASPRARSSSS